LCIEHTENLLYFFALAFGALGLVAVMLVDGHDFGEAVTAIFAFVFIG